ncbi:MAG: hypothetical protein VYC82_08015 [Verrucomicrobiota bacterium]|nr:hypothetical protein [Verrucomicrobiota bacterium]
MSIKFLKVERHPVADLWPQFIDFHIQMKAPGRHVPLCIQSKMVGR